jgi:tryptophan 2,3-dioxygenase
MVNDHLPLVRHALKQAAGRSANTYQAIEFLFGGTTRTPFLRIHTEQPGCVTIASPSLSTEEDSHEGR